MAAPGHRQDRAPGRPSQGAQGVIVHREAAGAPAERHEVLGQMGQFHERPGPSATSGTVADESFVPSSTLCEASMRSQLPHDKLVDALVGDEFGFGVLTTYVWKSAEEHSPWAAVFTCPVHNPVTGQVGVDISGPHAKCALHFQLLMCGCCCGSRVHVCLLAASTVDS